MAIPHAVPGQPVDLRPAGESLAEAETNALIKNDSFEVIRLVLRKGHEVCHEHQVAGPVTFQCLKGRVALGAEGGATQELHAGHWAYLPGQVPHRLHALEDSLVLLTLIFH